jgi:hypothetical protein
MVQEHTTLPNTIDESAAQIAGKLATTDLKLSPSVGEFLVGERDEVTLPISKKTLRMTHGDHRLADGTFLYELDGQAVEAAIEEVKRVRPDLFAEVDIGDGTRGPMYYRGPLYLHVRADGATWLITSEAAEVIQSLTGKVM